MSNPKDTVQGRREHVYRDLKDEHDGCGTEGKEVWGKAGDSVGIRAAGPWHPQEALA